jgi:adenine-specific DNA-methyltransferase
MPPALRGVIESIDAELLVVSCSNEGWVTAAELREWCTPLGHVEVLAFDSRRYVGAQIGVFNPQGERVGEPTHFHNVEHVLLCGERRLVERCVEAVQSSSDVTSASTSARGVASTGA